MDRPSAIVLAAGNGQRVDAFIRRIGGRPCPKQFYAFTGRRSMLEHTLARVETLIPRERVVVVVSDDHAEHVQAQLADRPVGNVVGQPRNLDTLPGVLLPLVHILGRDPDATVAVFPSDHFVWDEARFMESVHAAAAVAAAQPERIVLLGVKPDAPETEYGWIAPAAAEGASALGVRAFVEKPSPSRGRALFRSGCLWNTLVFVTKAATLYAMAREVSPHMTAYFDALSAHLGTPDEERVLRGMYARMESLNLSRDLFRKRPERLLVLPVGDVGWSDWGREERIIQTLDRYKLPLRGASPGPEAVRGAAVVHA